MYTHIYMYVHVWYCTILGRRGIHVWSCTWHSYMHLRGFPIYGTCNYIFQACPPRKGYIRGISYLTGYLIREQGPNKCQFTYVSQSDPRGKACDFQLKFFCSLCRFNSQSNIITPCLSPVLSNFDHFSKSDVCPKHAVSYFCGFFVLKV